MTNEIILFFFIILIGLLVVLIYFLVKNEKNKPNKCLLGCKYVGKSGNCGESPCKTGYCPYTCTTPGKHIGVKGWCQYDKYGDDGNSSLDCSGCGCVKN